MTVTEKTPRYAIYYSPAKNSLLETRCRRWLDGHYLPAGMDSGILTIPNHYGLHATLKPPFVLTGGRNLSELHEALAAFCKSRQPFQAGRLQINTMGNFISLSCQSQTPELENLAKSCVTHFDAFRKAPCALELEKRLASCHNARQKELVHKYGYPFVLDQFTFHLTLTATLPKSTMDILLPIAKDVFAPVCGEPVRIDSVCLFYQPDRSAHFCKKSEYFFG